VDGCQESQQDARATLVCDGPRDNTPLYVILLAPNGCWWRAVHKARVCGSFVSMEADVMID
jgi:hypothetical protein